MQNIPHSPFHFFPQNYNKEKKIDRDYELAVTEEEKLFLFIYEILNDLS